MAHVPTSSPPTSSLPEAHEHKSLLRFITCGSVDDGKSTLIGRLLYESKMLFEDQLAALEADSKKAWHAGRDDIDFALLVDGLAAEREQGITIDVAYRFFSTDRRKFIVADTPGHEQYTRNMVTGASTADAAVLMVDARKGVLTQTRATATWCRCSASATCGGGHQQDGSGRLQRGSPTAHRRGLPRVRPSIGLEMSPSSRCRPSRATTSPSPATQHALVPRHHADGLSGNRRDRRAAHAAPVPSGCRCSGSTDPTWISAASPARCWRTQVGVGDRIRVQPSGQESTVARIVTHDGDLD
jgi:bifunctional enzyme CysN/CysC